MKHYGYFDKQGKLQCESFRKVLSALKDKRCSVVLSVEEFKAKRSTPQNRYYWGVVVSLIGEGLKDAGWEPRECSRESVHEMLKREYLTEDRHIKDGIFVKRVKSTTELDTAEFSGYVEHCCRFAAEFLGVAIPAPNEQMDMELTQEKAA